jgi:hypothetical protein
VRKRSNYRPKYDRNDWSERQKLSTQPWRIKASLEPIEKILNEIEATGSIDTEQGHVVFRDAGSRYYYNAIPAMNGVLEMFEIAAKRHNWPIDLTGLTRLAKKLDVSCPLVQADIDSARKAVAEIYKYAPTLTLGEADDLVSTVRISQRMERLGAR